MQDSGAFPTPRQLYLQLARVSARVSTASVLAIAAYLFLLLKLSLEQWLAFGQVVAGLFVVLFVSVSLVSYRMQRPLLRYLAREESGGGTEAELHTAYWTLTRLALWMSVSGVLWWLGGGALVAGVMSLLFDSLDWFALSVMVVASTSGGLVSMVVSYYLYKRDLADLTSLLGARIGDPQTRRDLQQPVPLAWKTIVSVTSVTIVMVFFSIQLALVVARAPLERFAADLQARYLAQAAGRLAAGGVAVVPALADELARLGLASGVVVG